MITFDTQPTLTGELLQLRPLHPDDFDALYQAASDPLIWEQHPQPLRYQRDEFQRFCDNGIKSGGALVVVERASGRIIGSSRYYDRNIERREIGIGHTFLERAFWGGRYNRELKRLMLDHAFQFVDKVVFHVGEKNLRSQMALKKIGAVFSTTRKRTRDDGSLGVDFIFEIVRENWNPDSCPAER